MNMGHHSAKPRHGIGCGLHVAMAVAVCFVIAFPTRNSTLLELCRQRVITKAVGFYDITLLRQPCD